MTPEQYQENGVCRAGFYDHADIMGYQYWRCQIAGEALMLSPAWEKLPNNHRCAVYRVRAQLTEAEAAERLMSANGMKFSEQEIIHTEKNGGPLTSFLAMAWLNYQAASQEEPPPRCA